MKKSIMVFFLLMYAFTANAQECPSLTNPADGSIGVPVSTTITWNEVQGIIGYLISLGTTPGGTDILNRRSAGLVTSFTPEVGLPDDTIIYVTIEMFLPGQQIKICPGESFRTVDVIDPPACTSLVEPLNNSVNISVNADITWAYAPTATGYRISMGTSSGANDIADNEDVGNVLSYNTQNEYPLDAAIFVEIVPYNENGDAGSCNEESFTTGVPNIDCLFYYDAATDTSISLQPEIDFPQQIGLCEGDSKKVLKSKDKARGFRWFQINEAGIESLLSETAEVEISGFGRYRYEAYNTVSQFGATIECANSQEFTVVSSEIATIDLIQVNREGRGLQITIEVSGAGNYEYALDNENGPFQISPVFSSIPTGEHIAYVRDKNGCGITQRLVEQKVTAKDFPQFFTPNGDGINDYWQFAAPVSKKEVNIESLWVFDRLGNLMAQIDPKSKGWNGNFNGQPVPSSDYWFQAVTFNRRKIYGHFTLKR